MTFAMERDKLGRRPITIVELDLDYCANVYGSAPCTAAVGTTGTQKCFNCFKTCQDQDNFVKSTKTYTFCSETDYRPIGVTMFPCVKGVDIAPTQLDPKGLSVNASVTVSLADFSHHDRGIDPYVGERDYDPEGTFFGKLRARNPFMVNRVMRVKTGYIDENREVFTESRTYFIDRMEGPDPNGAVKLIGKGLLKFADDDKAQVPVQSRGKLDAGINATALTITLTPAGIGAEYDASGKIRIDDEIISYSSIAGDVITVGTRGDNNTTAASHDADAPVQLCIFYDVVTVADVLYDFLVNYAAVPAGYIDKTAWDDEAITWLSTFSISTILTEPTGLKEMLQELLQSCGASVWWDEVDEEVKFKVTVPYQISGEVVSLDEQSNIVAGSLSVRDLEKDRISRVVIHFGSPNFLKKPEKEDCPKTFISVDSVNESENAYGVPVTVEFASRWLQNETAAGEVCTRLIARYGQTPREVTVTLDAKDTDIRTGDLADISSRQIQSIYGGNASIRYVITQDQPVEIGSQHQYRALQITQQSGGHAYLFADTTQLDFDLASDVEKERYFFLSDDAGLMADGTIGATLI